MCLEKAMSKAEQCVNEALGKLGTVIYNNLSDKDRVLVEGEIKKLLTKVASGTENNKANHERASRYLKQVAFQAMEDEAKFAQLMLGLTRAAGGEERMLHLLVIRFRQSLNL